MSYSKFIFFFISVLFPKTIISEISLFFMNRTNQIIEFSIEPSFSSISNKVLLPKSADSIRDLTSREIKVEIKKPISNTQIFHIEPHFYKELLIEFEEAKNVVEIKGTLRHFLKSAAL